MANVLNGEAGAGSGAASMAGYEYQIDVSVWLALDIVLANRSAHELILEPASQEDIEADLTEFEPGRVASAMALGTYRLVVQAKLRNGDAWSVSGVRALLLHGQARESAAQRLENPAARYLLVTSAGVNGEARNLQVRSADTWPLASQMPSSIASVLPANAGGRVAILANCDEERIRGEIKRLLTEGFRVPFAKWHACHTHLREEARARMAHAGGGCWSREDMERVISHHEGYFASSPELEHYIHPTNWQVLRDQIRERHAAVIVGQSGTGKTLATRKLYQELRMEIPGLARVPIAGDATGAWQLREDKTPPPVLYDIEDPWGKIDFIPDRRIWNAQLKAFFSEARADRMFVATTRIDVAHSAGALETVDPWRFALESEHYGPDQRHQLFGTRIASLPLPLRPVVRASEDRVLEALASPLEIQKFFDALRLGGGGEVDETDRSAVDRAIAQAHHDAIERTVIDQIEQRGDVRAATVLWCLLQTGDRLDRRFLRQVEDRLADEMQEFEKGVSPLVDFFVAARNFRQVDTVISYYHPRVEAGIEQAMARAETATRKTIRLVVDVLASLDTADDFDGIHAAARLLAAVAHYDRFKVGAGKATQESIDQWLAERLNQRADGFEESLRLAAAVGSSRSNAAELARFLLHRPDPDFPGMHEWGPPPHDAAWYERLRADPLTRAVLYDFVWMILPYETTSFYDGFADAAARLADNLTPAFMNAAAIVLQFGVISNDGAIAEGALKDLDGFERIVDGAIEVQMTYEDLSDAQAAERLAIVNGELNDDHAEYLSTNDDGYTADRLLRTYVETVRRRAGWQRLAQHRHLGRLRSYWLRALEKDAKADPAEIAAAVQAGYGHPGEGMVWQVLSAAWSPEFANLLQQRLLEGFPDRHVRMDALSCAILHLGDRLGGIFGRLRAQNNTARLVEIAIDLAALQRIEEPREDGTPQSVAARAARFLPEPYGDVLSAAQALARSETPILSEPARSLISDMGASTEDLRIFRIELDEHMVLPVEDDIRWLLAHSADDGAAGLALKAAVRHAMVADVRAALTHRFAHVVALALEAIAAPLAPPLSKDLLAFAEAKASPVRRALLRVLDSKPHPSHLPCLLILSRDHWTERSAYGDESEDFPIARAAVSAIEKSGMLDQSMAQQLFHSAVSTQDYVLRRKVFALLVRSGEVEMHKSLLNLAIDPARTRTAAAAAGALYSNAAHLDPALLAAVTPQIVETRGELAALLLFVLVARRADAAQTLTIVQTLAVSESRRVFLLVAIKELQDRDPDFAARIATMMPLGHAAIAWVRAGADEALDERLLHDLGDDPSVNAVTRFLSIKRRPGA
jgi:hypothetical protein